MLLSAESISRRWNIGRLSVGRTPWRWGREASLEKVPLDGWLLLAGPVDLATLLMRDGRIEQVSYACAASAPR